MAESPSGESTGMEAEHGPPVTKKAKGSVTLIPSGQKS